MCNWKARGGLVIYKIIAAFSLMIRLFYIPNPFEMLEYGYLINIVAKPFLHFITFHIVGLYYQSRDWPFFGSVLYLFFYCIHAGLLMLIGYFEWNIFALIIVVFAYIGIHRFVSSKVF